MKQEWKFRSSLIDGEDFILKGMNIWDFEWRNTGKNIKINDPLYQEDYSFTVWEINNGNQSAEFAAGEFSNGVWGIYLTEIPEQ